MPSIIEFILVSIGAFIRWIFTTKDKTYREVLDKYSYSINFLLGLTVVSLLVIFIRKIVGQ